MDGLFSLDNMFTLGVLILLQAVLGFDNLLYISIESRRVEQSRQAYVRRVGISLAIIFRIILLFAIVWVIKFFQAPIYAFSFGGIADGVFNVHSLIVLVGGVFLIYTAVKEILYMLSIEDLEGGGTKTQRSTVSAIAIIVVMNLVFSFDSILSAIALTDVLWLMIVAVIVSGIMMVWLSDHVAEFLKKNRMYEVLGLFILFIVGILLLSEGGHLAQLHFFGFAVEPMSKTTFYFVIGVLIVIQAVQSRYRKKLVAQRQAELAAG
ncbi:hypothetical protein MnTg02_00270 [bacterium MnTg02]|nr:hypothetical protein MnTg02_00270 [bacterium MnTg02]